MLSGLVNYGFCSDSFDYKLLKEFGDCTSKDQIMTILNERKNAEARKLAASIVWERLEEKEIEEMEKSLDMNCVQKFLDSDSRSDDIEREKQYCYSIISDLNDKLDNLWLLSGSQEEETIAECLKDIKEYLKNINIQCEQNDDFKKILFNLNEFKQTRNQYLVSLECYQDFSPLLLWLEEKDLANGESA